MNIWCPASLEPFYAMGPASCHGAQDDLDWSNFTVLLLVMLAHQTGSAGARQCLAHCEFGTLGAILDLPCGKDYLLLFHVLIY